MSICTICGKTADTRPYGPGGVDICFSCAMRPENAHETERQFAAQLTGCGESAIIGLGIGPIPGGPEMLDAVLSGELS
jgi:hypothetical protein